MSDPAPPVAPPPIPPPTRTHRRTAWLLERRLLPLAALLPCTLAPPAPAAPALDPVFAEWRDRADPAIERALAYLGRIQNPDGSFPHNYGDSTGIPALAGMAFLSKGHLPTGGPHAQPLNRAIDFVLANQRDTGLFEKGNAGSGPMYAHNIATLFLSECSGMVDPERQQRIARALPMALALILRAQEVPKDERDRGGWRYHPASRDSDTSCSGWALMALRSAKLNGAPIPERAINAAVAYLHRHQHQSGCFGYSDREDHALSLTGMGVLCLELCGQHGSEPSRRGADWVLKHFRDLPGNQFEVYGNYYNAQAMFQIGGRHWREYAAWMYATYLPKQQDDGRWDSNEAGPVYGTSMMVLAFTVPWRQLPIYQRDETVDDDDA